MSRIVSTFLLCFVLIALVACGGGSSSPPPPPPSISITPSSVSVTIGGGQTFTTNAAGVSWSLTGPGTITQSGVYTAPSSFPGVGSNVATITATAGGLSGRAIATVVFANNNAGNQSAPIKLGTSGGNVLDNNTTDTMCCIGTLGSLLQRGTNLYILSNNHVLARSSLGQPGEAIDQPGQPRCPPGSQGLNVAALSQQAPLKPTTGTSGPAPSNVDAAIAQIVSSTVVDTSGSILDFGTAGSTSIGDAPPSGTPISAAAAFAANARVAKSGRTTGLTCSTIQAISVDNVQVQYDQSCGGPLAFTATFNGQVAVAGGSFSAGGDSGSLIVTADTAAPLALLYAGNSTSTVGNPILDSTDSTGKVAKGVLSAFNNGTAPTIVGGAPHAVSCDPTAQVQSAQIGAQSTPISAQQRQMVAGVRDRHAVELMSSETAIRSVTVGASADAPGEGALVLHLSAAPTTRIPAMVEGVRTQLVYEEGVAAPLMTSVEVDRGLVAKDNHRDQFMQRGFQGVGIGRSDDAPGETAIVIYTIKGEAHAPIPAVLDGVRTKIIEGERFRASGWNSQLEPKTGSCAKPKAKPQPRRIVK